MGNKRALIVGINYVGTGNDLQGCINDANNVQRLIVDHFGFADVRMVLEKDATTQNIKNGLLWLVAGAKPGDVLYFHYSGHGSQIVDTTGVEADGLDEIICPIDLDWNTRIITDKYMKSVFDTVPAGVNLLVFLDSCHSGGGLDQQNQYQPYGLGVARDTTQEPGRYMAPPHRIQMLIEASQLQPKHRSVQSRDVNQTGVLLAGCQSQQTSADAYVGGIYQGAATYSMLTAMKKFNYNVDYKTLVVEMNDTMKSNGFSQRPELDGSPASFDLKVFSETTTSPTPSQPITSPDPVVAPDPVVELPQHNSLNTLLVVGGFVVVLVALVLVLMH